MVGMKTKEVNRHRIWHVLGKDLMSHDPKKQYEKKLVVIMCLTRKSDHSVKESSLIKSHKRQFCHKISNQSLRTQGSSTNHINMKIWKSMKMSASFYILVLHKRNNKIVVYKKKNLMSRNITSRDHLTVTRLSRL